MRVERESTFRVLYEMKAGENAHKRGRPKENKEQNRVSAKWTIVVESK